MNAPTPDEARLAAELDLLVVVVAGTPFLFEDQR